MKTEYEWPYKVVIQYHDSEQDLVSSIEVTKGLSCMRVEFGHRQMVRLEHVSDLVASLKRGVEVKEKENEAWEDQ